MCILYSLWFYFIFIWLYSCFMRYLLCFCRHMIVIHRNYAAVLDFILSWKARRSMSVHVKLRYILKVLSAAAWVVILPITYAYTWENPPGFAQTIKSWFGNNSKSPSLFILAITIYLSPNMLAAVLFLLPFIRRFLERSNYRVVMLMMWWSQARGLTYDLYFSC